MSVRPKVHREELSRAIRMIVKRRAKVDDTDRYLLPDAPDSEPREVLDYLLRFSGPNIPRWVLQADVGDALTINNWLWWEDRRRELRILEAGRSRGLFLAQLGAMVGVGKQGVLDRIDRLSALLTYDRPDEKLARADRKSRREAQERRPAELTWIDDNRATLTKLMHDLVDQAGKYRLDEDDREWIDQLAIDVRDEEITPATMVILGLACAELRATPDVLALTGSRPYGVHAIIARCDAKRSEFAALGTQTVAAGARLVK